MRRPAGRRPPGPGGSGSWRPRPPPPPLCHNPSAGRRPWSGDQLVAHRGGEGGGQVGHRKSLPLLLGLVDEVQHGGLQPGEGHVQGASSMWTRGRGRPGRPPLGGPVQGRPCRVAQAHHPGDLVKALPCRVVPGAPRMAMSVYPLTSTIREVPPTRTGRRRGAPGPGERCSWRRCAPAHGGQGSAAPQGIGHRLGKAHPPPAPRR